MSEKEIKTEEINTQDQAPKVEKVVAEEIKTEVKAVDSTSKNNAEEDKSQARKERMERMQKQSKDAMAAKPAFNRSSSPRSDIRRPRGERNPGDKAAGGDKFGARRRPDNKRKKDFQDVNSNIESSIIQVRRVSKSVKGGKKMKFSALIVAGDKKGKVGFGLAKGLDFQDAVNKATKKAKESMITLDLNDDYSIKFSLNYKFKSAQIYLKPALSGTGLIAGGFLRPVLQLAGVQNIYSKIIGTNNKVVGVRGAFECLNKYFLLNTNNVPAAKIKTETAN